MRFLKNISIQRKQTLIILMTSSVALLLACIIFAAYDVITFRQGMIQKAATLAEIIGNNSSAALDFDDPQSAQETLSALRAEPNIETGCIYTKSGETFAVYDRVDDETEILPEPSRVNQHFFRNKALHLFRQIDYKGDFIGTVYVETDMRALYSRLQRYAIIVAAVFLLALLVALFLSARLQKLISDPILHLVKTARNVALEKNYSVRAIKQSEDELGTLVDSFNEMLSEIQVRDAEVQKSKEVLEQRVEERTHELAGSLALIHATLESTADGLLVTNADGKITNFNEHFTRLWRIPSEIAASKAVERMMEVALCQLKYPDQFVEKIQELHQRQKAESFDILEFQDGRVFERYSKPQQMDDKFTGRVWSFRDVTERKKAEVSARVFSKLSHELSSAASAKEAAGIIGKASDDLLGWDAFHVKLRSAEHDQIFSLVSVDTIAGKKVEDYRPAPGTPTEMHRRIMNKGGELILRNKLNSFLPGGVAFGDVSRPSASLMFVPIRYGTQSVGILSIQSYTPNAYDDEDLRTLQALADQCGGALERIRADEALRESELQFRLVWNASAEGMRLSDASGNVVMANDAYCRMVEKTKAEVEGKPISIIHCEKNAAHVQQRHSEEIATNSFRTNVEKEVTLWNGKTVWFELSNSHLKLPGRPPLLLSVFRDVTLRKKAEADLDAMHRQLLDASRQAGMADVATNVLHNVGNVLNSVNVSGSMIREKIKKSKGANLQKVVTLLQEQAGDLPGFFGNDPKGKQLPGYLSQLSAHMAKEREDVLGEIGLLVSNIEHIKEIVAMQQSYAKVSGVSESLQVVDLVEDALRMNAGALARHDVKVTRDYSDVPPVVTEKHKVLQILVNLVRNAKYACDDAKRPDKHLTVRIANNKDKIRISVSDNGIGISPENLTRIFAHGFTTRKEGHGFGLHSGALAATEIGGSLSVHSDGLGKGAEFILELPALNLMPNSPTTAAAISPQNQTRSFRTERIVAKLRP